MKLNLIDSYWILGKLHQILKFFQKLDIDNFFLLKKNNQKSGIFKYTPTNPFLHSQKIIHSNFSPHCHIFFMLHTARTRHPFTTATIVNERSLYDSWTSRSMRHIVRAKPVSIRDRWQVVDLSELRVSSYKK